MNWNALEERMHRDVGRRGLAGYLSGGAWLDRGQLRAAALDLAGRAASVGIVTGFCALVDDRVTAETDGPPGALYLARVLRSHGVAVTLITDRYAVPLLECGCDLLGISRSLLVEFPFEDGAADGAARTRNDPPHNAKTDAWIDEFLSRGPARTFSHLVAIERPGPSHTLASFSLQTRPGEPPAERFMSAVPGNWRDVCLNMRGEPISGHTAKIHRLFEVVQLRKLPISTIGIGDGGNEIGLGRYAWEDVARAIGGDVGARIACRIATDFALIAGVSNWGAYALALAFHALRGGKNVDRGLGPDGERELIEALVARAGAVDGRTLRAEPTVDGLALDVYLQPLAAMLALVARA